MIFWILLGLAVVAVVSVYIYAGINEGFGWAFAPAAATAAIAAFVGGLLMLLLSIWFGPSSQYRGEADHKLAALQTADTVNGRFFLGSGYVNGNRTLNYITDDDGAFRIESAAARNSVVYQDADSPTVTVHEWYLENPWFAPWSFSHWHTFTFHVPEGSILSDYTITNE